MGLFLSVIYADQLQIKAKIETTRAKKPEDVLLGGRGSGVPSLGLLSSRTKGPRPKGSR